MVSSKMSKVVVIKSIQSNLININQLLRTDIEASNRGILALSSSGLLTLIVWRKKKVLVTHVEDVSDALWQKGGVGELIAACHSGALFRYACHQDTGLSKTLQLSAQSLLTLINTKDSSIKSLKSLRIWGHTVSHILLQPQPDRLVLMSTNSGGKPGIIGVIKTPNVQSAHIAGATVIVQPCTGSDIYIHDVSNCKTIEVVTLKVIRPGTAYIQWDYLACSFSASRLAVTDSERRLYVASFDQKKYHTKKNGIKVYHLRPRQVVWPAAFEPASLNRFILSLSEHMLSVFCSATKDDKEEFYYFTCGTGEDGTMCFQHKFTRPVSLLPGLNHEVPDLFLTEEGVCMITDKECQPQNVSLSPDFDVLLASLEEALKEGNMEKIYQIKAEVEEDLGIFLSSCNHKDGWVDTVEARSKQHARLVNTLLSHLSRAASSTGVEHAPSLVVLREMAKHHFKTLQDEMANVLKYVDAERVSQQLLKMVEQMNFYLKSVEAMKLPDGTAEDRELLHKFEVWGDRPVKEILSEALSTRSVRLAQTYLGMKPWIYGQVETPAVVATCVEIARTRPGQNQLLDMDESYVDEFRTRLLASKELREIRLLDEVLRARKALNAKQNLCLFFVKYIHQLSPHLIAKPPPFWLELITYSDSSSIREDGELTIGSVLKWTDAAVELVLLDLFARVDDDEILSRVDPKTLWKYFLLKKDDVHLLRWINFQICGLGGIDDLKDKIKTTSVPVVESGDSKYEKGQSAKNSSEKKLSPQSNCQKESLLGGQMYCSDSESLYSLDSSVLEGAESAKEASQSSVDSIALYVVKEWPEKCFVSISQEMIEEVAVAPADLREGLLNVLAQYGLFLSSEQSDPQKMVKRLICVHSSTLSFKSIKNETLYTHRVSQSTLDKLVLESFIDRDLQSPFYEYVHANNLRSSDSFGVADLRSKAWVNLVSPFQAIEHSQAKDVIYDLCLETLSYFTLSKGDLSKDCLSVFLTMLYAPNATLKDFLRTSEDLEETSASAQKDVDALNRILSGQDLSPGSVVQRLASEDMPHLQPLLQKPLTMDRIDISVYDLLRGNISFDMGALFTWQKYNKFGYSEGEKQPCLDDEAVSAKEGVKCSLDYYYYLKAGRPTYALASILLTVCSSEEFQDLESKELSVYGLALSSWPDKRILSACVALLFIARLNYETLRTILFAADLIIDTLEHQDIETKIHENLRKSQLNLLTQEVKGFLFHLTSLSTRQDAASKFVSYLEDSIIARVGDKPLTMSECPSSYYGNKRAEGPMKVDLSSKESLYYVITGLKLSRELCSVFNLPPPQKILEFLAKEDQWVMFLICVQLLAFPVDVVMKASSNFDSPSLKEHVQFCLNISKRRPTDELFKESPREEDEAKSEPDDEDSETIKGGRHSASSSVAAYSWDGKNLSCKSRKRTKRRRRSHRNSAVSVEGRRGSFSFGSECSKIPLIGSVGMGQSGSSKEQAVDVARDQAPFSRSKWENCNKAVNVFSVVLKCHKQEKPSLELIEASVALRSPVLSVIAACYDSNLRLGCLAAWLFSYIPPEVIQKLQKQDSKHIVKFYAPTSVADLVSAEYLEKLIAFYLSYEHVDIVIEAFKVFDDKYPVLPILQALECTKRGCDVNEIANNVICINDISESGLSLEGTSKGGSLYTSEGISKLCVTTTCRGIDLYLKNRYLQTTFMRAILPFCDNFPLKSKYVHWNQLYKILTILGSVNTSVNIFECDFSFGGISNTFDTVIKNLVKFLIDSEEYEKAFEVASLLKLDTADIFCCQLESEFDLMKNTTNLNVDGMNAFLFDSEYRMMEKEVPEDKVTLLFECIAIKARTLADPIFSYLALQYAVLSYPESEIYPANETLTDEEEEDVFNWTQKMEELELAMWCSYIEAKHNGTTDLQSHFQPNKYFNNWPWEFGYDGKAKWLNYDDIEKASVIKYEFRIEGEDFGTRLRKYFKTASGDDFERVIENEATSLINEALGRSLLVTACRIKKLFGLENQDVKLMKLMLKAACASPSVSPTLPSASGSPSPSHSGDSSFGESSLRTPRKKGLNMSFKSGSYFLSSQNPDNSFKLLTTVYKLSAQLSFCFEFAKRILILCRIAENLSLSYLDLINHKDPTNLLIDVLSMEGGESFELAKDLISSFPIETKDVNALLFVEVIAVISGGPGAPASGEDAPSGLLTWQSLDQRWPALLTLTPSPSAVGHQLIEVFHSLAKDSHPDHVATAQTMSVETMIRAHDCVSVCANMEGINVVLQACPSLTKALLKHNHWSLMARLLTGIKRYKEMSYIIDILRDNEQFERLLDRPIDHSAKLESFGLDKTLVHFLRSNYPDDRQMFEMVAIHFLMFSELAKMWEEVAEEKMNEVLEKSLYVKPREETPSERPSYGRFFMVRAEQEESASSSPSKSSVEERSSCSEQVEYLQSPDVSLLTEAMRCYCDASKYCIQEKQLMSAMRLSQQAELVSVQLGLIKKTAPSSGGLVVKVIRLTEEQLSRVTMHHLTVPELVLVSRAYGACPDWASALYFHYIRQGDLRFLEQFLHFSSLSTDIAVSIVKKIEKGGMEPEHKERMSKLLSHIGDVNVLYKLASQLDLRSKVEESLEAKSSCFLKDTVFWKGISSSE